MSIKNLLFSPVDGRLRSAWRVLFFFVLNFSLTLLILLPTLSLFRYDANELSPRNLLIGGFVSAVSLGIALYAARRSVDRKSVESLGLQPENMWRDMGVGIGISGLMMLVIFLVLLAGGWLEIQGFVWQEFPFRVWGFDLLNMVLLFLIVGITEEVQFRGYVQQNLEEGTNPLAGLLLSSLIFSLLHAANPDAFAPAPLIGLFLAGVFFAFAYLRTRALWLAIGLHIGWNLFENTIFGFAVSGVPTGGILLTEVNGPELITGGGFGPEAGLVLLPALLIGAVLVYRFTKNQ